MSSRYFHKDTRTHFPDLKSADVKPADGTAIQTTGHLMEKQGVVFSGYHVPVVREIFLSSFFNIRRKFQDFFFCLLPNTTQHAIVRMKMKCPGHGSQNIPSGVPDPHNNASVKFALCRAVVMDSAPQETAIRTEKPAGMGMFIGKGMIRIEPPFVIIHTGHKLCPGGNAFACKFEGTDLFPDYNVISQVHAAGPALPAGKCQLYPPAQ
jgi:hypothetical protein